MDPAEHPWDPDAPAPGGGGNTSTAESDLPDLTPSFARAQPVVRLTLARDERPAVSADGEQPIILDSYDDSGQIMFELFKNGETESKSLQELLSAVSVAHRALTPDFVPDPDAEVLHWIAPEVRNKALRSQAHLIDVISGRPAGDTSKDAELYDAEKTTVTERRTAKRAELGWSASTMSRREAAYRARGIVGLIPHSGRKAQLKNVIDVAPEILAVIREHAQAGHLGSKKHLQSDYAAVIVDLRRRGMVSRNPGTPGPDGRELPGIDEVLPYHRFAALWHQLNGGRTQRNAKTRHEQSKRPTDGPLRHRAYDFAQMLEVDATPTDFFVQGPDGEPRRAYAVFAVCVSTKMTWLRLVREPPRGRDLALLLFDIIGGHCLARAEHGAQISAVPSLLQLNAFPPNAGPPPGVLPTSIRLDHGAEEENTLWISLCAQLSIELHWAATMTPTDKAFVESLIHTFAISCQLVPSHKGNTVVNRPKFISPGDIPTFEQAARAFSQWPEWAANQPHTGLQVGTTNRFLTPIQAVLASLRFGNVIGVLADPTLALRLLPTKLLKPEDDGVTWERRRYWCEDYQDLKDASTRRGEARKLAFFYDPQAKHRLYWIEPGTFNVRRLSSPGADSGVAPAFDSVRRMIATTLGHTGQKWPTHTEIGERRADLLELFQQSWNDDDLNPDENVVPLRRTSSRTKRKGPAAEAHVDNGGWRLEDFIPDTANASDSSAASVREWDEGITGGSRDAADPWGPTGGGA